MRSKAFSHRPRLTAIPADGFIEILRDTEDNPVPEYMPTSLLLQPTPAGLTPVKVAGTPQAWDGTGNVTITEHKTTMVGQGTPAAISLADGALIGQLKVIQMISDIGQDITLTPDNFADGTNVVFADAGDTVKLIWDGSDWNVTDILNRVDGVSAPAIT